MAGDLTGLKTDWDRIGVTKSRDYLIFLNRSLLLSINNLCYHCFNQSLNFKNLVFHDDVG
jgi:hypothetical protein